MLAEQRHAEILKRVEAGGARVADLAHDLSVTEETIRRDLEKLGREGRLIRTHGGALPLHETSRDAPFDVRRVAHHEEKVAIARRAVTHVRERDVIALDPSSTVHELTRLIPDIPLTVVTNALIATVRLLNRKNVRVLSTGGLLDQTTCSWVGSFTHRTLEHLNINKLFLSAKGVDLERGLSEVDDAQADVKRRMMALADETYLLVDHSKFRSRSAVLVAGLEEIDVVITDAGVDPQVVQAVQAAGCRVEVAEGNAASAGDGGA
jgi:DeoR/GlpR family transcriptional regulator of sugar metabolism